MTLSLTATCTNDTGLLLTFQPTPAIHGEDPVAAPSSFDGGASIVTAVPIDVTLGPSPQGAFGWSLPGGGGEFVFAYDLHDTPISLVATAVPPGYAVPTCTLDASGTASVVMTQAASIAPVMPQIETIVFLMLENRSLDNVLGWLQTASNVTYYPPGSPQSFDGIPSGASNSYDGTPYAPAEGTAGSKEPCRVPAFDPYETLEHVQVQLYADGNGNMPSGSPWETTPAMSGFAYDYDTGPNCTPGEVMGAYAAAQLPVLYGLAQSYAVSDRWFSSAPTQTDPNRAFSVCGTSLGAEDNSDVDGSTYATANTIFNVLGQAGKSWGLYWQMDSPLGTGEPLTSYQPYTSYYFPQLTEAFGGGVYTWSSFTAAAAAGTLPNFCYLEPYWGGGKGVIGSCTDWVGIQGNDYHPPAWVGPAEASLAALYELLVASPQWKSMLLVITFDEHGGTYDHVPPTAAAPPDGNVGRTGFAFDRLGVRVPTILVSPFIAGPTVFRAPAGSTYDFDHTSFLATFCKWAGVDPTAAGLGARVAVAPTFEGVLSTTPRSDTPTVAVPPDYASQGGGVGTTFGIPKVSGGTAPALDVHELRRVIDEAPSAAALADALGGMLHGR